WFLISTVLSAVLPNTVVAAVLCSIAMAMLKFVGEGDVEKSSAAKLVLLAIVWGANNGGMFTPLGGAMNLITVSYIEELTGAEFLYTDWVRALWPFALAVTVLTLVYLLLLPCKKKTLEGSKTYFSDLCKSLPKLSRAGRISLIVFAAAALLAFTRQLYQRQFPVLKPGFVFLIGGLLMFFLRDEEKKPIITWEHVEQNLMWGMFFLFAGGTALGALVNGSGASEVFAGLIARFPVHNTFLLVLIIVTLNVVLSDVINNTACAAVTIPIVIGAGPLLPVISLGPCRLYPTRCRRDRSIPIGYGLSPRYMFVRGIVLTVVMVLAVSVIGWALITFWPGFSVLTNVG
ncbi:MAG: SLC13 family permease, partial [Oscillospiraceae bacterium]